MIQKIIEVVGSINWGKFLLMKFTEEWQMESKVSPGSPLLQQLGWSRNNIWVLDLQTGEGAFFRPGGLASADLNDKHQIWCCPMYEPFLNWLYKQDLADITKLPDVVRFSKEQEGDHAALWGRRRKPRDLREIAVEEDVCIFTAVQPKKSSFIVKYEYGKRIENVYECENCKESGYDHRVIDVPGPLTDKRSDWGAGKPTTMRKCTRCGFQDGPWISTDIVGDRW